MFLVLAIVSLAGIVCALAGVFPGGGAGARLCGAVMVLFLFVIMLLDLKEEQRRKIKKFGLITGVISVGAMPGVFVNVIFGSG